jgi:eukaryotic-like serine/threonine-protein kinase
MPLEGLQLGHYRLIQLLGRGAMGEVYLAEDTGINRQVAIKVIRSDDGFEVGLDTNDEATRLFQHEMRTIARLNHPHILPLFDYGEAVANGTPLPYMVVPFIQDGSLAAWLKRRSSSHSPLLSPLDVADIIQQAAGALQYAHDQHIIHRDIKPSNFLVRLSQDDPNRPYLLLADFGLARLSGAIGVIASDDGHPTEALCSDAKVWTL